MLRDTRFPVYMGDKVSSWQRQKNSLPHGSVMAPALFNLYTNDLPAMKCLRFIYADDICWATQAVTFKELDNTLTADLID